MAGGRYVERLSRLRALGTAHPVISVVSIYAAFRAFNLAIFEVVSRVQGVPRNQLIFSWDSLWLIRAAESGWEVPAGGLAEVSTVQTTWAWPPLAPLTARWLSQASSFDVQWTLVMMNLVAGGLAAVILWRLVTDAFGPSVGLVAASLWSAMPASPVLIMAYAEGLFIALVFAALLFIQRSRFIVAGLFLVPAGLTKIQVAPFALALIVVLSMRRWQHGEAGVRSGTVAVSSLLAVFSVVAWPVYVAVKFGSWNAYSKVQAAWNWEPWPFTSTVKWLGNLFVTPNRASLFAFLAIAVAIAAMLYLLKQPKASLTLKAVSVTGPLFLLAVGAGASTVRYTLSFPAIPAAVGLWARGASRMISVTAALMISQIVWIVVFVAAGPTEMPP